MAKVEIEMPEEGTRQWALIQIGLGKKVVNDCFDAAKVWSIKDFLQYYEIQDGGQTGWRIYEEPLPVCRWKQHKPDWTENSDDDFSWVECDCMSARGETLNEAKARWREINGGKP